MLGEEITDPSVVNFQARVRFDGPTAAVEEWVGVALNVDQLLEVDAGISVIEGDDVGVGASAAVVGAGVVEGVVEVEPMAHSWLSVEYSVPEVVSTAVVTLPGII